ncbi:protein kinase [Sorangium sp. So ce321]|uniref:serine/threonine-protein kinase n=1 Tax=Sorangium sp. So ce321 TaxID=3133300 RepID=UPI003F60F78F
MGREALKAGDVFLDYRITEVIDAGGMGEVYKAVEDYSEDVVAIKCMSPRHVKREDFAIRFRQECRFYPKLKHPNIVRMRKAGVSPADVAYIVMDYLEGRTLRKLLNKAYRLDFLSAMHVMLQVADAMTFVHSKGIWHRDLKPENIMVGAKEEAKGHVWLLDFGIAKFADGGMNTDDLPDVGTVRYISPEQVKMLYATSRKAERPKPDGRTDIYAFGAIFYEVLTGKHLFLDDSEPATAEETLTGHLVAAPEPVHEIVPDCPEFVWPVVSRCIAIDREERYARFDEVARDLRSLLRDTVPAGHVLARRLAQERMKAERQAAFAGVELEDSAPTAGEAGEEETDEARARGESEGGGMGRASGEREEQRARRVVHGETAPLEQFVAPASPLPFAPASREPARVPRGRGVGYTEPLPSMLPPLRPREATARLAGTWAERMAPRGGPPPLREVRAQAYAEPPPLREVRAQAYAGPPPLPVMESQRAAPAPLPVMETPRAMPPLEVAAQHVTPPLALMGTQRAASAPLPAAAPPPAPSAVTAPSARPAGSLQTETPAAMIAQPRRAMRVYVLAPLLALGITVVGVGAALGIRAMSGGASEPSTGEPAASAVPAGSVSMSGTSAASTAAPAPVAVPAAPAPEATASAAKVSAAEEAAEAGAPGKAGPAAEAEAPSKEQQGAKAPPGKAALVKAAPAPAEAEDDEDIYPMPTRQKPSFLRVLSERRKQAAPGPKAAPANAGGAKPAGPCPAAGCRPF